MKSITESNLENFLNSDALVVFWSSWCGPCMDISYLKEISSNINIGMVNVGENSELAKKYSIIVMPTYIFFKDKKIVKKIVGLQTKETLQKVISNLDKYV
jgi:thioredoxin 1